MKRVAFVRRAVLTLLAMGLLAPLLFWGSQLTMSTMFNSPPLWLPATFPERVQFEQFRERFEGNESVVVTWPGCTLDDERLKAFGEQIRDPAEKEKEDDYAFLFDRVITGYEVVRELTRPPLDLTRRNAVDRVQGVLAGPDGEKSCAVVILRVPAERQRARAIDILVDEAARVANVPRDEVTVAGPPLEGATIDAAGLATFNRYAAPSALLCLLICWFSLRSWRYSLGVFAAAMFGQGLCMSLVYAFGITMNAVLIVLPPLVFVLTVSAGVHLVNYYRNEVQERGVESAAARALKVGWLPCTLAALTTAIGLASLLVSDVEPIRVFGAIAATGVMVTLGLLFLLLPGAMELWPMKPRGDVHMETAPPGPLRMLAEAVIRFPWPIALACAAGMFVAGWGLQHIETSVKLRELFPDDSKILRDYAMLEEEIGPLAPVEVVVSFQPDSELDLVERLELIEQVQLAATALDDVGGPMSALTFAPALPPPGGTSGTVARTILRRRMEAHLDDFQKANYLYEGKDVQAWRVSLRTTALSDVDYGRLLDDLRHQVNPLVEAYNEAGYDGVDVEYTGVVSLAHMAQEELLEDLFKSFLVAFMLVTLIMMISLKSVPLGAVVMLPNLFPTVVLFGLFGWADTAIDIGSVMTASVALGVAVDGTLHFIANYLRDLRAGMKPEDSVRSCFGHCGRAMSQTTLIFSIGLLVFVLSPFVPAQRFALMMVALLIAALVGDLVMLPGLLLGPARRLVRRNTRSAAPQPAPQPETPEPAHVPEHAVSAEEDSRTR